MMSVFFLDKQPFDRGLSNNIAMCQKITFAVGVSITFIYARFSSHQALPSYQDLSHRTFCFCMRTWEWSPNNLYHVGRLGQSAGIIYNSTNGHGDPNDAPGPMIDTDPPWQIRIFNVLDEDGYSTDNAPPSGNNDRFYSCPSMQFTILRLHPCQMC